MQVEHLQTDLILSLRAPFQRLRPASCPVEQLGSLSLMAVAAGSLAVGGRPGTRFVHTSSGSSPLQSPPFPAQPRVFLEILSIFKIVYSYTPMNIRLSSVLKICWSLPQHNKQVPSKRKEGYICSCACCQAAFYLIGIATWSGWKCLINLAAMASSLSL